MKNIDLSKFKQVGKVLDAHGIRGDIYCLVFSGEVDWLEEIDSVVLVKNNETNLFPIKKIKQFKKGFIAHLEGFLNRNIAEEYKAAEVWVSAELFVSDDGESLYLSEIAGFAVIDAKLGVIGKISSFSSNGIQDLLIVESQNGRYEIPFVDEFVETIDFENKTIKMLLPNGLLEINNNDYDNHDGSQNSTSEETDEN